MDPGGGEFSRGHVAANDDPRRSWRDPFEKLIRTERNDGNIDGMLQIPSCIIHGGPWCVDVRAARATWVTWCNLVTISCAGQNIGNGGQDRLSRSPAMPGDICRDNWNISSIHLPLCETSGRLRGFRETSLSFCRDISFFPSWKSKISWNKGTILERDNAQRIAQFRSQGNEICLRALRFYVKRFEGMYIVTNF